MNHLVSIIDEKIKKGDELKQSEVEAVKKLLRVCLKGYCLSKVKKRAARMPLGVVVPNPVNPLTLYEYGGDTKGELQKIVAKMGWCGQFAGRLQWEAMGRKITKGYLPCYSYESIYKKPIDLFSYEQTEVEK